MASKSTQLKAPRSTVDESDSSGTPKQFGTSILQEIQNLKDKFKNDEDNQEKGEI